ncbi:MAG TPA: hypothetical protein VJY62_02575 [Bacteroidia bacterium]|nr:hypothetical protein [Bacteroidia bacterium]
MQLRIDWDPVHKKENNPESQAMLELRREDFNEQCWQALKRMLNGDHIINKDPYIGHMARRAKDLKDFFNIPVKADWATDAQGNKLKHKWYYIPVEYRLQVAKRIIGLIIK